MSRWRSGGSALIMASATPAASLRGQNVQVSDKYGIRRLWSPSSVAESGRCGDRSLSLDVRRLTGVRIRQEKCTPVIWARTAPIPLLALPCRAMSHNIRAVTVGAVEYFENHDTTLSR